MVTRTRPVTARTGTPERWAAALDRARAAGVAVTQDPITGRFSATSTDRTRRHEVSWYGCTCWAAIGGDEVCLHRAAFREHCREEDRQLSLALRAGTDAGDDWDVPFPTARPTTADDLMSILIGDEDGDVERIDLVGDPTEPADDLDDTPAPAGCYHCMHSGVVRIYYGGRLSDYYTGACSCPLGRSMASHGLAIA